LGGPSKLVASEEVSFLAKGQQHIEPTQGVESETIAQAAQNEAAVRLLHQWLADESGYDERVWPRLKEAIEEDRLSYRKRFSD
jgi:hypothetical protein